MRPETWSLILAAGSGRRLSPLTGQIPKQFWRPDGRPSLLDDAIDRLVALVPAHRTVTVVDRAHRLYVEACNQPSRLGAVVYQPEDRGTAAGVLLGLTRILASAGDPIVIVTPSDHGVALAKVFRSGIRIAMKDIQRGASEIVLFGAEPGHPDTDYGWITPGPSATPWQVASVASFVEKPSAAVAQRLFAHGAVWNTMVLVAQAGALMSLFQRHLPDLCETFDRAGKLSTQERQMFLTAAYAELPRYDFSRDLLTPAERLSLVVWPHTMGWSDLGTPERLLEWEAQRPVSRSHEAAPSAA